MKKIKRLYIEGNQTSQILRLGILYIILGLFGFAMSYYLGKITQNAISSDLNSVLLDLLILTVISLVFAVLGWYIQTSIATVKHHLNASFKTKTAKSLIENSYDDTHSLAQGDLIGRLSSDTASISTASSMLLTILKTLTFLVIIAIGMIALDFRLALVFFVGLPFIFAFQYYNTSQSYKKVMPWKEAAGKAHATAQDILNNRSTIKTFNLYDQVTEWMDEDLEDQAQKGIKGVGFLYIITIIMLIINFAPTFMIGFIGLKLLSTNQIELSTLITIITLATYANQELNDFQNAAQNMPHLLASTERIFPIWDAQKEQSGNNTNYNSNAIVEFNNLSFAYPKNPDQLVLDNISFTVNKGEKVGIVGTSGSGKSTIIKLISKFYEPSSGQLNIFKTPICDWNTDTLRSHISLISQNFYLFDTSIKNNLLYAKVDASEEEMMEALRKAQLEPFIKEHGIDYVIGEKGSRLSGGQRQRLSIARALLQETDLYLLDEATSALDNKTEKEIQDILNTLSDQSQIVIAHRLSTIEKMDRIIVLDKGRIVEEGSHNELLELNGIYKKLYEKEEENHE